MAAYNGRRYIEEQLRSILVQLEPGDEVIVVDDGSRDGTPELVEALGDGRVRVRRNPQNLGVVRSFGRAITEARGEVIFLADQDDLWMPGKVERVLRDFSDPEVQVVVTDAYVFDERQVWLDTFFQVRGSGPGIVRNTFKNAFVGCCMAFRADLRETVLPLPEGVPMHDWWIGLLGSVRGRASFIDEPLIAYRRHAGTATTVNASGLRGKLRQLPHLLGQRWRIASGVARRVLERRQGG